MNDEDAERLLAVLQDRLDIITNEMLMHGTNGVGHQLALSVLSDLKNDLSESLLALVRLNDDSAWVDGRYNGADKAFRFDDPHELARRVLSDLSFVRKLN